MQLISLKKSGGKRLRSGAAGIVQWISVSAALAAMLFMMRIDTAAAQTAQAQIAGTVKDSSGAVIPGATITATNERTQATRTAIADQQGYFIIPGLQPSNYIVKVAGKTQGFAPFEAKIALLAGESATLNPVLKPAGTSESITVVATQEAIVDTDSASIGANVNDREVHGLPLNGRQLSQLYLQAPGSVNTGSGSFFDIRFSGRSNEQNAVRYDGIEGGAIIDANPGNLNGELSSPFRLQNSLENVQEFRVESNSYPAEYGTGSGGQISVVTKSGSNQFHGSVFEYLRNDVFDARNFFDRIGKSPLRLNQFGASVGGPIKKDKAFFFASFEGYRLRSGVNLVSAVPSDATRSRAVPAVAPLIDAFRGPGAFLLPGASTNPDFAIYQLRSNVEVDENSGALRLDYKFNDRFSMYARYFRDQGETSQPEDISGRRAVYRAVPQNGVVAIQGLLTTQLINEAKFGYNGALTRVVGSAPTVNGIDLSLITINISGNIANTGIPGQGSSTGVAVPGGLIRGTSAFNGHAFPYTPYSLSFVDNLSWVKAKHNIKFGMEVRLNRLYLDILGGTVYSFSNLSDFLANRASTIQYGGNLSDPSPFNSGAAGNRLGKAEFYIGYAQDAWKIRPDLTLNYGLRYEYYTPLREARNLNVQFDMVNGVLFDTSRPFLKANKTNFAPRVGLAWSPNKGLFGGKKTVMRAGFGIYYGPGQMEDQIQPIHNDRIVSTQSGGSYPLDINAVRSTFATNTRNRQYQPRAYSPDYKIPERIYQYSLGIQQELPYKLSLTASYVGSQGTNLFLRSVTNKTIRVLSNGTQVREFDIVQADNTVLRPYAEVDFKTSGGWDSYDALQVALGRRFSGLTMNSQYTWGRSYGNSSGSNDATTTSDLYNLDHEAGYNNFDIRQSFNLSALYSLPFAKSLGGAAGKMFGGWELGMILNARTGLPMNILINRPDLLHVDANGLYYGSSGAGRTAIINNPGGGNSRQFRRPDVVAGVDPYLNSDRTLLNPAAFSIPRPGTSGNLMRNALRGKPFRQVDIIVNKRFTITESSNVEFRAEFFNMFNLTNFANPPVSLANVIGTGTNQLQPGQAYTAAAAGAFGTITSTVERTVGQGTSRQIQFALRFNF